ncbi:flagellar filament capping protein FliD [Pseudogulbenkiania subflava]|uniref:Flagellar hook-associated protein 2 n=1 Tax=Pseudogulbenkiania subflava DSM 22618 TaxID=1123014 RepID=A0A1Y6BK14_9NEIS|nr:flagellar filament capping protein FliD [Pseudogulbenkiania subflava]SMF06950.1 flagellar hook-associated protein 2 [Pseudogulbenkiania subflava DSM 22618]
MADINPTQMATQLANLYVQQAQQRLSTQNSSAKARSDGLSKLQSALQDFRSALSTLSAKKSMVAMSASFSQSNAGTVSASGTAQAGSYSLFVEQLASAQQLAYDGVSGASGGTLTVSLGGNPFSVDLASADRDGDHNLTTSEIALAINQAAGNAGKVNAMVLTANGISRLVLTSGKTGTANTIGVDASQVSDPALQAAFAASSQLSPAQDAKVWLGGQGSGVLMKQASNTFTSIDGVTMTFGAPSVGQSLTLDVARSDSDTGGNVQNFVDAYNTLLKSLGSLTAAGGADKGQKAGPFATDAGVRSLRDHLNTLIRQSFGGVRLSDLGITAARDGTLSLDRSKLDKLLANQPTVLDGFFNGSNADGLLAQAGSYLDKWLNASSGLITQRKDSAQRMQNDLDAQQTRIDNQYDQAYKRYLAQFTQLQTMQAQMSQTLDSLNSYFSSNP